MVKSLPSRLPRRLFVDDRGQHAPLDTLHMTSTWHSLRGVTDHWAFKVRPIRRGGSYSIGSSCMAVARSSDVSELSISNGETRSIE